MFLAKGNVETIWDVLQDEKLPNMNQQVFINNIKLFGEKERSSGLTLYQMNTKFTYSELVMFALCEQVWYTENIMKL